MSTNGHEPWYQVRFDAHHVHRAAQPPGEPGWTDRLAFDDISRVCLEIEEFSLTDGLYIFTRTRPESYAIPMSAEGALDLLNELIRRGLFDAQMAIDAAAVESGLFCWPEGDNGPPVA